MAILSTFAILSLFTIVYFLAIRLRTLSNRIYQRIKFLDTALWEHWGKPNGFKFSSLQAIKTQAERKKFFRLKQYKKYNDADLERLLMAMNINTALWVISLLLLLLFIQLALL